MRVAAREGAYHMAGLSEIVAGHWSLKGLVASMILVFVGLAMTIYNQFSGGSQSQGAISVTLKCVNPSCPNVQTMTSESFRELTNQKTQEWMQLNNISIPEGGMGPEGMMMDPMMMGMMPTWGQGQWPLPCPQCQQNSFYIHLTCPKCSEIYMENLQDTSTPDKCPKCHYSRIEERRKERQDKKKADKEAKKERKQKKKSGGD